MAELDGVNRRDAIAGLGVLGALLAMLVGTIFYRIMNPSPPTTISLETLTIAPDMPGPSPAPPEIFTTAGSTVSPLVQDERVGATAFGAEPLPREEAAGAQPTFIAPGEH